MSRCGGGRGGDGGARGGQDNTGPESRGSEFEPLSRQLAIFHLPPLILKRWADRAVFALCIGGRALSSFLVLYVHGGEMAY